MTQMLFGLRSRGITASAGFLMRGITPLAFLSLLPCAARAQGTPNAPGSLAPAASTVAPGDAIVDGSRITAGTVVFRTTLKTSGQEMDAGTMTYVTTAVTVDNIAAWQVSQALVSPGGGTTDTVVVAQKTLAPISLHGYTPAGSIILRYQGRKVTGEQRDPEGSAHAIDQTLSQLAFDSNTTDLVLASLPLKAGYTARLPVYLNEQGLVWFDVKVTGERVVGGVPAWEVTVVMPDAVLHYTLDKTNQSTLVVMFDGGGMQITMTRKTN